LVLWNNDPFGPASSWENKFGVPTNLQNGRVQSQIDSKALTLLTPDLPPLSNSGKCRMSPGQLLLFKGWQLRRPGTGTSVQL